MENAALPDDQDFKPASELVDPVLVASWKTWRNLAGDRFAPSRKEIVPARFKEALASIFIMEVVAGGADFRFALGGETLAHFMGGRHKGGLLSSLPSTPMYDGMRLMFGRCVQLKAPVARGPFRVVRDRFDSIKMEVLVMPLSEDTASVTGLLGAVKLAAEPTPGVATS